MSSHRNALFVYVFMLTRYLSISLQVGVFACVGPVLVLKVNPHCSSELVCGDELSQLYFLSW